VAGISAAVFSITGLLALVTLLVPLAARANLAFSLVLAAAGIVLGLVGPLLGEVLALPAVGLTLPSDALILVFLPVLLFETAVAIDGRRLLDDLVPILVLAVVAVLVSTFVVGWALAAVAPVGLVACLLLAAMVSTTDPIAVVGIFRDLGVPHRLSLLIEGESLFNDAAAIALVSLFLGMLTGERQPDPLDGALAFGRGFLGGLAVGGLGGLLVCGGLTLLRGQRFAEITLTVAAAYLVFLAGEQVHVSGVVAVVTTALVIGYYGRTLVSAETWSSLVDVWRQLGYWASALVFLLATMRVPGLLAGMGAGDLGLLAVVVVAALAARGLVLFGLFPLLTRLGWAEPIAPGLRLVVVWGGLRGAISLALALAVVETPGVPEPVQHFVAVLCTGFVLVTLFINAPLLRPLIRLLGLDRLSPSDQAVRRRAIATALDAVRARIRGAAGDYGIAPPLAEELAASYTARLAAAEGAEPAGPVLADETRGGLAMLTARETALYLRHYREGIVSGRITRTLLANAARLEDALKTGGVPAYVAASAATLAFPRGFRLALAAQRRLGLGGPLAGEIATRTETLLMTQAALGEMRAFAAERLPGYGGATPARLVARILDRRAAAVETALAALRLQYADYSKALELHYLERAALRIEAAEFRRLRAEAVIGHEVFFDLMSGLARRGALLSRRPRLDLRLDPATLVARVPAFAGFDPLQRRGLTRLLRPRLVVPGEVILRRGEPGDAMYFISSGAVEVRLSPHPVRLGSGEFFGEMALLAHAPRNADVVALGYGTLLALRARDFHTLFAAGPAPLRQRIGEAARERGQGGSA